MDITETAAYHGDGFQERKPRNLSFSFTSRLSKTVIFMPVCDFSGTAEEYQFVEVPDKYKLRKQLVNLAETLEEHGTKITLVNDNEPNCFYGADRCLGIEDNLLISKMASKVRKEEEINTMKYFRRHNNITYPWKHNEFFEVSNLIPSLNGWFIGVGARMSTSTISRLKGLFNIQDFICISHDVQHLMGVMKPLPDGKVAVRSEHIDKGEIPNKIKPAYKDVFFVTETNEVVEKEAMNFVIAHDRTIILPDDVPNFQQTLEDNGYKTDTVDISEIRKGGGGISCVYTTTYGGKK